MIIAAALCPAPPLLARELTGAAEVLPDLRQACLAAVADAVSSGPDLIIVVGVAEETRACDPAGRLDLTAYAPGLAGLPGADAPGEILPLPLGLGSRLLDQSGYAGPRELQSVSELAKPADCASLGAALAGRAQRAALVVMADGSACRGLKAPGYLDERSAPFDAAVERAVRDGDMAAMLALDADLARDLMAAGRPALQVLAGALEYGRLASEIRYSDDPFGVAYLVASLRAVD